MRNIVRVSLAAILTTVALAAVGLTTVSAEGGEDTEDTVEIRVPAELQRVIVEDELANLRALRERLTEGASDQSDTLASVDQRIAELKGALATGFSDFYMTMPVVRITRSGMGDGIAFSQWTYKGNPSDLGDMEQSDPTMIVLWGEASHDNVWNAFNRYSRPVDTHRWGRDDGQLCVGADQYVAMANTANPSADDWHWVRSRGMQPKAEACGGRRHHFRYFSSNDSRLDQSDFPNLGADVGTDGTAHFNHWTVIGAHRDATPIVFTPDPEDIDDIEDVVKIFTHPNEGWEEGETRVLESLMLPEPAGFPWVLSHEVLKDMGNAGTYGANDYYNDGNGHLVRIATPEAGTGAEFADDEVPSTVIALASGNRIGVSWVGESTLNTYYMVELWRPLDDVTLSFPDITYHSTTSTAVLATGLRSSEEYFVRVLAGNDRHTTGWSGYSRIVTDAASGPSLGFMLTAGAPTLNQCVSAVSLSLSSDERQENIRDHGLLGSEHLGLVADCTALLAAKDALIGTGENARTLNWSGDRAISEWDGVTLAGTPKRVTRLHLPKRVGNTRVLTGVIPEQLGSLAKLKHLSLVSNQLMGAIPGELGELGSLSYLSLHTNRLSGSIPAELGKLKSLQQLYLRSNSLSGAVPMELGNLGNLFLLDLRNNSLSDAIPTELGNLELSHLWLAGNSFSCVPPDLRSFTNTDLASLNLPDCKPEVSIAAVASSVEEGTAAAFTVTRRGSKVAALTVKVRVTDGEGAFLQGADPREETVTIAAGALSKRLELDTDDDETDEPDGSVTATVRANTAVYDIDPTAGAATVAVTDNDEPPSCLTGTAVPNPNDNPGLVADCTALLAAKDALIGTGENARTLNWSADTAITSWDGIGKEGVTGTPKRVTRLHLPKRVGNDRILTGVIPEQLGSLAKLAHLVLVGNQLTGAIPAELGELGSLGTLNLSSNSLSGAIPKELGELENLVALYLRSNSLSGAVPKELGNLSQLEILDLSKNNLSDAIPTELGNLGNLQYLRLAGNAFTDCVPPDLRDVTSNDVASLNLPDCDVVAPAIVGTPVATVGGDPDDKIAAKGETITVTFLTSEPVAEPTVKIADQMAIVSDVSSLVAKTSWKAVYTPSVAGVSIANVTFDVGELEDASGNTFDPNKIYTGIAIDTIAPTVTVGKATTSGNEGYAKEHDTITVPFATSPDLAADPTATIGGEMAKVDPNDNEATAAKEWTATYTVLGDVNVTSARFVLDALMDAAGNVTDPVTVDTNIEIDTIAPTISGDPKYSVTGDDGVAELNELITVKFVISEDVSKPTATIGGQTATVVPTTVGSKTNWTAKYTVDRTLVVDDALFDITGLVDLAGNTADPDALKTGIEIDSPLVHTLTTYVSPTAGGRVTVAEEGGATGALDISEPTSHKYEDGTQVRAKPITNDGYRFNEWIGAACETDTNPQAGANDCLITMDADKSITAFFVSQCELVVNDASGGKGLGSTTVDCGTTVTATADPDDDHRFGSWTGVEVCESQDDTCDLTVGTAGGPPVTLTLTPIFVEQCMVSVGDPDNGTITATGDDVTGTHDSPWEGDCGTVVTIKAVADSGYCWSGWDDAAVGETDTCEKEKTRRITITADTAPRVYSATFKKAPQCELEVTSGGGGSASGGGTYDCNTTQSISATADDGYQFDEWTGDAVEDSTAANTTIDLGDSDKSVEATFDKLCAVAGAPDPAAGGTVTGGATVVCGNSVTLTATANDGYCFTNWKATIASGASEEEGATGQACNKTGTRVVSTSSGGAQNQNFIANFHLEPRCTLTVEAGTGGSASGGGTYDCNTTQSISATADDGYQFDEWTGDAVEDSTAANTTIDLGDSDKSVEATFDKLCTVAGAPDPAAGGTVTGGATVVCGNSVTLTATANDGYCFTNWKATIASGASEEEGATGQACNKTGTRVVSTSSGGAQNQNFIANFHLEPRCTLTVEAGTGGSASGGGTYDCNTTQSISATADDGYQFDEWTGDAVEDSTAANTTIDLGDSDKSVEATFDKLCTVAGAPDPAAGGTVTGGATVVCGNSVTLTATANDGYCFTNWKATIASGASEEEGATGQACNKTGTRVVSTSSGGAQSQNFIANFHLEPQCTLTVTAYTGGEAGDDWTGACGTTVSIWATASDGYQFGGWTGATVADSSAASTTVSVSSDITVYANFDRLCTLTVSANPAVGGSVEPETDVVVCGQIHRVVATASAGYCFDEWKSIFGSTAENGEGAEGENENAEDMVDEGVSGQDTCRPKSTGTLQSRANNPVRVFQAIFRKHEHTLTVTINSVSGGAGTLKEGTKTISAGAHTYEAGASVTLTAAGIFGANHQWGGDCSKSGASATCTIDMDSNKSISVTFYGSGGLGEEEDTLAE